MYNKTFEKIFFINKERITSSLLPEEVIDVLKKNVKQVNRFSLFIANRSFSKPYEGYIIDNEFFIRKLLIKGYSAFLPVISGKVEQIGTSGTSVYLIYKLHSVVKVLLYSILLFFGILFLINIINANSLNNELIIDNLKENINGVEIEQVYREMQKNYSYSNMFLPLFIMIFVYLIAYFFFKHQVELIKIDLSNILKT